MAQRVAKLGRRSALLAGGGRAATDPRGADRSRQAGGGSGPHGPRRRLGPLLHRGRAHRRSDDPDRGAEPRPRRRPRLRPGQGGGGDHPAGPQRGAVGARPGDGEPRRHRPPDPRRGDLDRDPRHRRRVPEPLGPGRGARAGAGRRERARGLRADRSRRLSSRPGGARGARGDLLGHPARRPRLHPASRRLAPARSRRPWPASTSWRRATTTSSSSSSPTPTRR